MKPTCPKCGAEIEFLVCQTEEWAVYRYYGGENIENCELMDRDILKTNFLCPKCKESLAERSIEADALLLCPKLVKKLGWSDETKKLLSSVTSEFLEAVEDGDEEWIIREFEHLRRKENALRIAEQLLPRETYIKLLALTILEVT